MKGADLIAKLQVLSINDNFGERSLAWEILNTPWSEFRRYTDGHPLDKPGTLIIIGKPNEEPRTLLIGDINPVGGLCDDCTDIGSDDLVIAALDLTYLIGVMSEGNDRTAEAREAKMSFTRQTLGGR